MTAISKLNNLAGNDLRAAVRYSLISRSIGLIIGALLVFILPRYMNRVDLGLYYLYSALIGAYIIFESGLSYAGSQYLSRVASKLNISKGAIEGEVSDVHELQEQFILIFQTIFRRIPVLIGAVVLVGLIYAVKDDKPFTSTIMLSWIVVALTSALLMLSSSLETIFEGMGLLKVCNQAKLIRSILSGIVLLLVVIMISNPLAIAASFFFGSLTSIIYLQVKCNYKNWAFDGLTLTEIYMHPKSKTKSHLKFKDFSNKIRISWISGYFIGSAYLPISGFFVTAETLAKFGFLQHIINATTSVATIGIQMSTAYYGDAIKRGATEKLHSIFLRTTVIAASAVGIIYSVVLIIYNFKFDALGYVFNLLPDYGIVISCFIASFLSIITASQAAYVRAHHVDPYYLPALINAALTPCVTMAACLLYNEDGIFLAYVFNVVVLSVFPSLFIYKRHQKDSI